jgi:hypothetical protein
MVPFTQENFNGSGASGYSLPVQDTEWWKDDTHPGVAAHQKAHKENTWFNGRFVAHNTSACKSVQDCYKPGKRCDSDLVLATECLAYEPWRVQCTGVDPKNHIDGKCIISG